MLWWKHQTLNSCTVLGLYSVVHAAHMCGVKLPRPAEEEGG